MNKARALAEQVGDLVNDLQDRVGLDQRWVSTGKTELQQGFMAIIRGIAQPTTF